MTDNARYHVVAKAVRLECASESGDVFIVFKVIDERFKQQIMRDWQKDVELHVIGTQLVEEE